jgi:GT2 family glycosyltransferase
MKTIELTSRPLVSFVVLTFNQTDVTLEFLESTRKLTYPNYEILICDMGSEVDPTSRILAGNYPHTKVYRSETNLGAPAGKNFGIRKAKGEFIFSVDNDTVVTPDLVEVLLEPFYHDPNIGVTCPKIRFYNNPEIIQFAGFNPINPFTGRNTAVGSNEKDNGQHDKGSYTFSGHGCAMMVKREAIDKAGMYPEKFFLYYDEMDWSARIVKAGYKIYYEPKGIIYHKQSMTLGKASPKKVYYLTKNRILYMRRNSTFPQFMVFMFFFTFFSAPKAIVTYLFKRQFEHLNYFIKGVAWNLRTSKHSVIN